MILVVDASVLVADTLRPRNRVVLSHAELTLFAPLQAWSEARHELRRRERLMVASGRLDAVQARLLVEAAEVFLSENVQGVDEAEFAMFEAEARRRMPRDPNDWAYVALALALGEVPILTRDGDFLGCGLATWTPETLRDHLEDGRT